MNCSCEVEPSAQMPGTGRERLTRFAKVNNANMSRETERDKRERLQKERENDRPSEALS